MKINRPRCLVRDRIVMIITIALHFLGPLGLGLDFLSVLRCTVGKNSRLLSSDETAFPITFLPWHTSEQESEINRERIIKTTPAYIF